MEVRGAAAELPKSIFSVEAQPSHLTILRQYHHPHDKPADNDLTSRHVSYINQGVQPLWPSSWPTA